MLNGYIDFIAGNMVAGWVRDDAAPGADLFVEVTIPSGARVLTRANILRENPVTGGQARCGFKAVFPEQTSSLLRRAFGVTARVAGTDITLPHGYGLRGKLRKVAPSLSRGDLAKGTDVRARQLEALGALGPGLGPDPACPYAARIVHMEGSKIILRTDAPPDEALPVVMVGNKPAWMSPDPAHLEEDGAGILEYNFFISGVPEKAEVTLSLAIGDTLWLAERRRAPAPFLERTIHEQLARAARAAAKPDAVALVCWNANSEDMARAAALMEQLSPARPAVLFCNQHDATGLDVWAPLSARDLPIVTIPWSNRLLYFRMIRSMGLAFDTVWICGAELPGFLLAARVAADDARLLVDICPEVTLPEPREQHHPDHGITAPGMRAMLMEQIPTRTSADPELAKAHKATHLPLSGGRAGLPARLKSLEEQADAAPRARVVLGRLPRDGALSPAEDSRPTLLLIWKQQDAGLYGRRVDQLCRSYRTAFPDHRVVVLDIMNREISGFYHHQVSGFSEFTYIREMGTRKRAGCLEGRDSTEYRQIYIDGPDALPLALHDFLAAQGLVPTNTVITLFPNIQYIDRVLDLLHPYPLITDVVDNQLVWASGRARLDVLQQYAMLCQMADLVLFNTPFNHEKFHATGLVGPVGEGVEVIPNWYQLPAGFAEEAAAHPPVPDNDRINLVYTGNMNDRIDWDLMAQVVALDAPIRLHLIGEASKASADLAALLQNPDVVYYGPLDEEQTLHRLLEADLALIPHVTDEVSTFMNPLKARMYGAVGLPAVAMNVPSLIAGSGLTIAPDRAAFLEAVRAALRTPRPAMPPPSDIPAEARAYIDRIAQVRAKGH